MSEENVEVVRQLFEAFGPDLDPAIEFWHSDLDYRAVEGALDDIGVFHGHEALRHTGNSGLKPSTNFAPNPSG